MEQARGASSVESERREVTEPLEHPQVTDFAAYLQLKNLASGTIDRYLRVLSLLFRYVDRGERPPSQITRAQLRRYVASLYERELAASTIETKVVAIKQFFGFLVEEGYIEEDPADGLPYPKVSKRLPKALKVSEVKDLFAVMGRGTAKERRDRVFFELLYTCGLRIGEAVRLKVEDVNWEDSRLRVVGKGDKERRVYLKPYVQSHLCDHVAENDLSEYLFPGLEGHISASCMRTRFSGYVQEAGLPDDVTPHTLRHSAAVHYLMEGAPITFVQDLLGHESLETTGIYTQLVDDVAREITLNTDNALYERGPTYDGVKESGGYYSSSFSGWAEFVASVLTWLAEGSTDAA
jgi:integrase/recombinase XerD